MVEPFLKPTNILSNTAVYTFAAHPKTLLLGFVSPFVWPLKLLCNRTTCRSFFTSLAGSISSSVNRVFAILLLS